jgi:hypothetical protein
VGLCLWRPGMPWVAAKGGGAAAPCAGGRGRRGRACAPLHPAGRAWKVTVVAFGGGVHKGEGVEQAAYITAKLFAETGLGGER